MTTTLNDYKRWCDRYEEAVALGEHALAEYRLGVIVEPDERLTNLKKFP